MLVDRTRNTLNIYVNDTIITIFDNITGVKKQDSYCYHTSANTHAYRVLRKREWLHTIWDVQEVQEKW